MPKLKIRLLIVAIPILLQLDAFSQGTTGQVSGLESQSDFRRYAATIIPPAPNAFSFSKYGNLPIGLNTGTMQFSIPIYTIKSGSLTHSIGLSYATNGVKVDEQSGWVGINWNLVAGGVVTRTILDKQDELYPNNTAYTYTGSDAFPSSTSEDFYDYVRQASQSVPPDYQPDEYSYNVDGYKGKFIKRPNGYFKEYNASGMLIEQNSSGFLLTAPNGVKYFFYQSQSTKPILPPSSHWGMPYSEFAPTAWYLSKIKSPTNDSIVFNYSEVETESRYINGISQKFSMYALDNLAGHPDFGPEPVFWGPGDPQPPGLETSVEETKNYPCHISSIVFSNGQVSFISSARDDEPSEKKVDTIKVVRSSDDHLIKCFSINYTYSFTNSYDYDTEIIDTSFTNAYPFLRKRLFLTSVDELSSDLAQKQRHQFEYEDINGLPPRCSYSQDRLGFFNGKINEYFFPNDTWFDWYIGNNYFGGDRSYSFNHAKKGVLKKITYPTGGFTEVTYEAHKQNGQHGYALRKDSVFALMDTSTSVYSVAYSDTFHYTSQKRPHLIARCEWATAPIPPYGFFDGTAGATVQIIDVSDNSVVFNAALGTGETIKNGWLGLYNYSFPYGVYKIKIMATAHVRCRATIERHWKEYDSAALAIGGVRVKSIADFANTGEESNRREFLYGTTDTDWASFTGLGEGINTGEFNNEVDITQMITWAIGGYQNYRQYCAYNTVQSSLMRSAYQTDAATVCYRKVIELNYASNNRNNGGTEYEFHYEDKKFPKPFIFTLGQYIWDGSPRYISGAAPMNNDFRTGLTKSVKHFSFTEKFGTRNFLNETRNYYSVDSNLLVTDSFYIVKEAMKLEHPEATWNYFNFYDVNKYFKYYSFVKLDSTVSIDYSNSNQLKNKVAYSYTNANYKVDNETHYLSNGETKEVYYRYPPNVISTETDYTDYHNMSLANLIGMPINQMVSKNGTSKSSNTFYDLFTVSGNSFYLPATMQSRFNSNSPETEITFEQYDSKGNILQFIGKDGLTNCIIWGYNKTYPVAKIVGASYSTAIALLDTEILNDPASDEELQEELDNLRTGLTGKVLITTFTYSPLIGMTSQKDAMGNISYYEYDAFNRLKTLRDRDNNILKKYEYKYVSQ